MRFVHLLSIADLELIAFVRFVHLPSTAFLMWMLVALMVQKPGVQQLREQLQVYCKTVAHNSSSTAHDMRGTDLGTDGIGKNDCWAGALMVDDILGLSSRTMAVATFCFPIYQSLKEYGHSTEADLRVERA